MKNIIVFLMLLISVPGFSQKKGKVDPKDTQIDSLTHVTVQLHSQVDSITKSSHAVSMKLDSVAKEKDKYYGVYKTISEKVVKYKFNPANTNVIIDSLRAQHDSVLSEQKSSSSALSDTLSILRTDNAKLQAALSSMKDAEMDKEKIIVELKQLKSLLDDKIITTEEYNEKKSKLLAKWE